MNKNSPLFFKTAGELRAWYKKNHAKKTELWAGLYKKGVDKAALTYQESVDEALCFGWVIGIIRGIDHLTYQVRFVKRKKKSPWSKLNMQRFIKLRKAGRAHHAGVVAFVERDKDKSEEKTPSFSPTQLKAFKANKKAWEFFSQQTKSYRKYTTMWVIAAKQPKTQTKRLDMLIADSASGVKLQRIAKAIEKVKKRHEPGKTPIEEARNIGPLTGSELRSIGLDTVEKLVEMGWEEAFHRLIEQHPHRINLNMLVGLIGAVEDQDWRKLDSGLKLAAKKMVKDFRR